MKINDCQHALLDSMKCVRLSSDEAHKELIKLIENNKNSGLVSYLNDYGWQEDKDGSTAFYIVKDKSSNVLLFFSLKCGALFQHLNEQQIQEQKQLYEIAKKVLISPESDEDKEIASLILDKFRQGGYISECEKETLTTLKSVKGKLTEILEEISRDKKLDPNNHIIRVLSTHSGIELVHFCANERVKSQWASHKLPHTMGKILFWKFVIPIVEEVRKLVGCKYIFLFAADSTPDLSLVNYYSVDLHFERPSHIGTSKPRYDFNCVFMCREIGAMVIHRHAFFESFNPDQDEDII